jgi:hypothetical protein
MHGHTNIKFLIMLPLVFYSCNVQCVYEYAYLCVCVCVCARVRMYVCTTLSCPGSSPLNVEHVTEVTSNPVTKLRAHTRISPNNWLYDFTKVSNSSPNPLNRTKYPRTTISQIHPSQWRSAHARLPTTYIASWPPYQSVTKPRYLVSMYYNESLTV